MWLTTQILSLLCVPGDFLSSISNVHCLLCEPESLDL